MLNDFSYWLMSPDKKKLQARSISLLSLAFTKLQLSSLVRILEFHPKRLTRIVLLIVSIRISILLWLIHLIFWSQLFIIFACRHGDKDMENCPHQVFGSHLNATTTSGADSAHHIHVLRSPLSFESHKRACISWPLVLIDWINLVIDLKNKRIYRHTYM